VFVSMTSVRGRGDAAATAKMAGEAMLSWLRDFDGYEGLIILADEEKGTVRIMTRWASREAAERSERSRRQVRESMVSAANAEIESVDLYEVVFEDLEA
jgi:heme-degrading monooxygenase HmoA